MGRDGWVRRVSNAFLGRHLGCFLCRVHELTVMAGCGAVFLRTLAVSHQPALFSYEVQASSCVMRLPSEEPHLSLIRGDRISVAEARLSNCGPVRSSGAFWNFCSLVYEGTVGAKEQLRDSCSLAKYAKSFLRSPRF